MFIRSQMDWNLCGWCGHTEAEHFDVPVDPLGPITGGGLVTLAAGAVVAHLQKFRFSVSEETAFQSGVFRALSRLGVPVKKEYELKGGHGRVDFYLPDQRIGLELKVKGSTAAVTRQVFRYAESGQFDALILVTTDPLHTRLPATMGSVAIHALCISRGWL